LPPKTSEAFSPGGISSFFEICDTGKNGEPLVDLERVGARGGGFVINKGVHTRVETQPAKETTIEVFINGNPAPEAETSRTVAHTLLAKTGRQQKVTIKHKVEVPIGAGFGSSAAGALSTALALSGALDLRLTYNQLGRIAHVAEIKCKTGLGTVGPIMLGGCILTVEPGGPGFGVIDRLPLKPDYAIITGTFGPTAIKQILASPERRREVNRWGKKTLDKILAEPSLENFLSCCWEFAEKTGFVTERVKRLVEVAKQAGAVGAAQNMVGEAVHAVTLKKNAGNVVEAFKKVLPKEKILEANIDFQGARLMKTE
jgi:pantoate kinase